MEIRRTNLIQIVFTHLKFNYLKMELGHSENSTRSAHRVFKAAQCGKNCLSKTPEEPVSSVRSNTRNFPIEYLIKY